MKYKLTVAIVVAGGRGTRMAQGSANNADTPILPKQYKMLGDKCILQRTIDAFAEIDEIDHIQVVIHKDDTLIYEKLVRDHPKLLPAVPGGPTRQQSVHCGLKAVQHLGDQTKVLVHDGARPFIGAKSILHVLNNISGGQGAIPAHRLTDTLKQSDQSNNIVATIPRERLYCAQTPQGFMLGDILASHQKFTDSDSTDFTDDASLFEAAGLAVKIIPAPSSNFKITTNEDLAMARMIVEIPLETQITHADIRTGNGYDVHAFEEGNGVVLGGVKIPFSKKLKGHSDADVVLHALCDALFGTIGAGDIGTYFPPDDDQWKNVDSHVFLTAALDMVAQKGGLVNNIDITIICEAPKIGPHRVAMQKHLAVLCSLDIQRVSIKATTNEKLGFLGRGEGIAALASATVSFGVIK